MITISLCMIVKNEEDVLGRCLDSVKDLVEEIIVVDTGSSDNTREIARQRGAKLYEFPWRDDFAAARNYAFDQATQEYLLWLDADDVLEPLDREAFRQLKETLDPAVQMVMMPYHVAFDQADNPTFTYLRERLMRRDADFRFEGAVHEAVAPRGLTVQAEAAVSHRKLRPGEPGRNLRIFEKMLREGRALDPRQQYYYARELMDNGRTAEAAEKLEDFLRGGQGWIENILGACRDLAACRERLGDEQGALYALLGALAYAPPRAELCCEIGLHFFKKGNYAAAAFWYELATARPENEGGGFHQPDCGNYIPYLQLCVCYDRLGDRMQAEAYNELAAGVKPDDPAVAHNRAYFASLKKADA